MIILDGKSVAESMRNKLKEKIKLEFVNKKAPTLAVVLIGNDPASEIYVKNKEKACAEIGINSVVIKRDSIINEDEILAIIESLNKDDNIDAIIVQLPLPKGINERKIINAIDPDKDVDCLSEVSMGRLVHGTNIIMPCTPSGIVNLLSEYGISLSGKHVVMVGRSLLVGRPMEIIAEKLNATTTLCHSKTKDLGYYTKQADVLIVATGRPNLIKSNMVKNGAIIIDVGINRVDGKLCGDVDFEKVSKKCSFITPVPGGVGPMTIVGLMINTINLAKNRNR